MSRTVKWEKITDRITLSFEILPINKILARAIGKSIYFTPSWKTAKKGGKKKNQNKRKMTFPIAGSLPLSYRKPGMDSRFQEAANR